MKPRFLMLRTGQPANSTCFTMCRGGQTATTTRFYDVLAGPSCQNASAAWLGALTRRKHAVSPWSGQGRLMEPKAAPLLIKALLIKPTGKDFVRSKPYQTVCSHGDLTEMLAVVHLFVASA